MATIYPIPNPLVSIQRAYQNRVSELQLQHAQLNDKIKGHQRGRNTGLVAILVGLALALFLNIYLGGFIVIIGLLAFATQAAKIYNTKIDLNEIERQLRQ